MTSSPVTIKAKRVRRTKAQIAEDTALADLKAKFAALLPLAEKTLANVPPAQKRAVARAVDRIGAAPKYRWHK